MDMEEQLKHDFDKIAEGATADGLNDGTVPGRACSVQWTLDAPSRAVNFDSECIDCVRQSAEGLLGYQSANLIQDMISGAGKRFLSPNHCVSRLDAWQVTIAYLPADEARLP